MSKNLNFTMLLDVYGALLTEKQRDTLDYYYNEDLSLGEISEEMGITRQGVMNCIRNCEQRLLELEEALGLVKRFTELKECVEKLEAAVSDGGKSEEITALINEIKIRL
ncbi:MAG: DNA-binding protein [Ruminiclostridium sp.]|nr:DNA-binding protein [Ruminiclostridium sp.]